MDKEDNYSASFAGLDYSLDHHDHHHHQQHELMELRIGESSGCGMIDHLLSNPQEHDQHQASSSWLSSTTPTSLLDQLSFADVMQFADFGPKLALNQARMSEEGTGIDPVYFLKFPVLNGRKLEEQPLMVPQLGGENEEKFKGVSDTMENGVGVVGEFERCSREEEKARVSDNTSVQLQCLGDQDLQNKNLVPEAKSKRKRPRTIKTSEEVASQRMTHIAVERNRRKQMNEHLRVLRSLMPGSYVQRGDQASIIGGAIEFVRELEQLLKCLESQKRRRLFGEAGARQMGDPTLAIQQPNHQRPFFPPLPLANDDQVNLVDFESGFQEETAENKSRLADVEVRLLGFDALIKILSRRRPGQLIKTIAALEDLQLTILHTNIATIEQTVLYSFNVKVANESRLAAEDIASAVQQIFSFIHANSRM